MAVDARVHAGTGDIQVTKPQFSPHPVDWDSERVSRFWDYLAERDAGEFFSEKHARDIAARLIDAAKPRTVVDIELTGPSLPSRPSRRDLDRCRQAAWCAGGGPQPRSGRDVPPRIRRGSPADEYVDAATLIETVEHLDDATLAAALAEARRRPRPGGILLVTTPNRERLDESFRQCPDCGAEFHVYQHVRSWTAQSLAATLRAAGLTPVRIQATRPIEDVSGPERIVRRPYYQIRRQAPRLFATASA